VNEDEPAMDSNGSGKSTLFDALDWCLWGQNPRKDAAQGVMNDEAAAVRGSQCAVEVDLEDDQGRPVVIRRARSKSKTDLEVRVASEDRSTLDTRETQREIERILGLDREVFHATVLFAQTDLVHYADSTDAERMEILTRLLQIEELDEYRDRAKEMLREKEAESQRLDREVARIDGQIEVLKAEDYQARIESWQAVHDQRVQENFQHIEELKRERDGMAAARPGEPAVIEHQKIEVDEELARRSQPPPEPPEIEQRRQEQNRLNADLAVARNRWMAADREWNRMAELGEGTCPHCHQPITAAHKDQELARLDAERREARQLGERLNQDLQAVVQEIERQVALYDQVVQSYQAAQNALIRQSQELGSRLAEAQQWEIRYYGLADRIRECQADYERARAEKNPHEEAAARRDQQVYELERKRGQIGFQDHQAAEDVRYVEFWVSALGPKGLKSYILDHRLQELTDSANEWLRRLTGGTMWVRFEAQRQTKKKLVNAPEIRVFRWNPDGTITERPYRRWSGGEKQRISWAIDFGLSQLIAGRSHRTYNILILDEIFRHLDSAGKESVVEILQYLAAEKDSLIVVEHDDQFRSQFESEVIVRKRGRRSQIEEPDAKEKEEFSGDLQSDPARTDRPRRRPVRRPVT
jgi:DNA repair exonuclease SbcCD ATPase subunit